jgi:hypothetical protein
MWMVRIFPYIPFERYADESGAGMDNSSIGPKIEAAVGFAAEARHQSPFVA